MKKVFLVIYTLLFACYFLHGQNKKDIQALSAYLANMVPIHKDNYYTRINSLDLTATDDDSLLILTYNPIRVDVPDFIISNHEVTNSEYHQFVNWVRDSISTKYGKQEIKTKDIKYTYIDQSGIEITIDIYPDTAVWINDFLYSYNEPLSIHYFNHVTYKNNPVVGISYDQANAYIHWLNRNLRSFLKLHHFDQDLCCYKLPTEIEWQYAAFGVPKSVHEKERRIYPWNGALLEKTEFFKANFGRIYDKNNVGIKSFCDDGYCNTSPVKSFKANYFNLYDMAGNVSEWVSDTIDLEKFKRKLSSLLNIFIPNKVDLVYKKISNKPPIYRTSGTKILDSITKENLIKELMTFSPNWNKIAEIIPDPYILDQLKSIYYKGERDIRILKSIERPGIIKGGSWLDPPIYMMSCITQVFSQSKSSSRLGFRVVMSMKEEMWKYLR